jgi:hypothetical protein
MVAGWREWRSQTNYRQAVAASMILVRGFSKKKLHVGGARVQPEEPPHDTLGLSSWRQTSSPLEPGDTSVQMVDKSEQALQMHADSEREKLVGQIRDERGVLDSHKRVHVTGDVRDTCAREEEKRATDEGEDGMQQARDPVRPLITVVKCA